MTLLPSISRAVYQRERMNVDYQNLFGLREALWCLAMLVLEKILWTILQLRATRTKEDSVHVAVQQSEVRSQERPSHFHFNLCSVSRIHQAGLFLLWGQSYVASSCKTSWTELQSRPKEQRTRIWKEQLRHMLRTLQSCEVLPLHVQRVGVTWSGDPNFCQKETLTKNVFMNIISSRCIIETTIIVGTVIAIRLWLHTM